jgi:hypothetical protein
MASETFSHFVFVDFENVQKVDLGAVAGKPVHITLLLGKNQTWLELPLVHQIRRLPAQIELIEVGASGRNALDLTLACYLGQAVQSSPGAEFSIVSKDKDFEAMIGHLQGKGIKVTRHDSFATLSFLPKPRKPAPARPAVTPKATVPAKPPALPKTTSADARLEKLVTRLKTNLNQRPKKRDRLLAYINTAFGGKLTDAEQKLKLDGLVGRSVLTIEDKDKVRYL